VSHRPCLPAGVEAADGRKRGTASWRASEVHTLVKLCASPPITGIATHGCRYAAQRATAFVPFFCLH